MSTALVAVDTWKALALAHAEAAEAYRVSYARAFCAGDKGTDTARKHAADAITGDLRLQRDKLEIETRAAELTMHLVAGLPLGAAR